MKFFSPCGLIMNFSRANGARQFMCMIANLIEIQSYYQDFLRYY